MIDKISDLMEEIQSKRNLIESLLEEITELEVALFKERMKQTGGL